MYLNDIFRKYRKTPRLALAALMTKTYFLWPAKPYLKLKYRLIFKKKLDLKNPRTYNEKLQWIKLYDHNPFYTMASDKVKVKDWVASVIGEQYVIPTLGVWERAEDVDFDSLPDKFVIKCNHNCAIGMYICTDKSKMDTKKVRQGLKKGLRQNFHKISKEWPYKDIPRRIIAEEYIGKDKDYDLKDYKIFCFDGKPTLIFVVSGRNMPSLGRKYDFFDTDFNHLPIDTRYPNSDKSIEKPKGWEKMLEIAAKLSEGLPYARIDLYDVDGKVYFGEFSLFHDSGFYPISPEEWDLKIGEMIKLKKD